MESTIKLNTLQGLVTVLQAKNTYVVAGRGVGKSTLLSLVMNKLISSFPGGLFNLTCRTSSHLKTSILPAAFGMLNNLGYAENVHYFVGKKPPPQWNNTHMPIMGEWEKYISFLGFDSAGARQTAFYMVSQEREGSGRGPNTDFLITDETLTIKKDALDNESIPTLRANKALFGKNPLHLGQYHSTSMPYTPESRWILDKGNYYMIDYGIDIFSIWKQITAYQSMLLDIKDSKEFAQTWNEISRLRKMIYPRKSKDGTTLFVLSNAFDNIDNLGLSYIKSQRDTLPPLLFQIEILNEYINITSNAYYKLDSRHLVYNCYDDSGNLNELMYNPNEPFYLFSDWGGTVSFNLANQYNRAANQLNTIKEFWVLPPSEMPKTITHQFCDFFEQHSNKEINFVRDSYGDSASLQSSRTVNEDAIDTFRKRGWKVNVKTHPFKEPPQHEKWKLMNAVMNESDTNNYFKLRINAMGCPYLVAAMQSAKVKQIADKFEKDKSSERDKKLDQRTATHPTDALDKGVYFLWKESKTYDFVPANF